MQISPIQIDEKIAYIKKRERVKKETKKDGKAEGKKTEKGEKERGGNKVISPVDQCQSHSQCLAMEDFAPLLWI